MLRVCRRGYGLLLVVLLTSLSLLFNVRRMGVVWETHRVVIINQMRGAYSYNNYNIQQVLNRNIATIATNTTLRNVNKKLDHSRLLVNSHRDNDNHFHKLTRDEEIDITIQAKTDIQVPSTSYSVPIAQDEIGRGRGGEGEGMKTPPAAVWRSKKGLLDSETRRLQNMFPLSKDFTFPNPQITLSVSDIDNSLWMKALRRHLASLSGRKIINFVSSNSLYQDVLLNWLISAVLRSGLELESVLVISLDMPLYTRLQMRGIPSVYIPLFKLIRKDTNFTKSFDRVMMLRLAVMRIISHWGFDVHNYDTDAILLRNPQPLYDRLSRSDIIGSVGRIPEHLMMKWGITICIGVVIIRSSPLAEEYWQAMSTSCEQSLDDQEKLNCGLDGLGMSWDNAWSNQNATVVHGCCGNGLRVSILPFNDICRLEYCDPTQRDSYHIWHKGGSRTRRDKLVGSREGRTWFLRYKWNGIETELKGKEWLQSISYTMATHS